MEISPPLFSVVAVQTLSYQIPRRENPPHIWICLLEKRGWTSDSLYRQSPKKESVRTSNTYRHTHTNTPPSMTPVLNSPSLLFWIRVKNENRERLGRVRREQSKSREEEAGCTHVKRGCEFKYSVGKPGVSSEHLPSLAPEPSCEASIGWPVSKTENTILTQKRNREGGLYLLFPNEKWEEGELHSTLSSPQKGPLNHKMVYLSWLLTRVQLGSRFSIVMCHGLRKQEKETSHKQACGLAWSFDYCSIRKIKVIIIILQCSQKSIFKIISLLNIKNKSPHTHQFLPIIWISRRCSECEPRRQDYVFTLGRANRFLA